MRFALALIAVSLAAGCPGRTHSVSNPVVGPPPPRIPGAMEIAAQEPDADEPGSAVVQLNGDQDGGGVFSLTSRESASSEPVPVTGPVGDVAARVNGTPIFVSEILEPYASQLTQVQAQASTAEFEVLRRQLVQRDLPQYIDQLVLYDTVMRQLDDEQREQVQTQLDSLFEEHLQQLVQENELDSLADLERQMRESGMSMASARQAFDRQQIAMQYLRESVNGSPSVSRAELLAEYEARREDYTRPARVRWEQIRISFARHGGRERAAAAVQNVLADLEAGTPFAEVAGTHSDGPMASRGGEWDWTQPQSVSDEQLQAALARLRVGEVSDPIEQPQAFLIIKLTGRRPQETTPFADVQNELRAVILERKRNAGIEAMVEKARDEAVITTMFDGEEA